MAVKVSFLGLDCRACSPAQKIDRGCEKNSPIPGKWKIDEESYSRCPIKLITRESWEYLDAWELIQSGLGLPYGAGWIKHSRKFLEAMKIVTNEVLKHRREQNVRKHRRY